MTATAIKPIALEEFLELSETKPASEFIDGQIIQKPMPQGEHSLLQGALCESVNQPNVRRRLAVRKARNDFVGLLRSSNRLCSASALASDDACDDRSPLAGPPIKFSSSLV